ncbi:PAS-domain containing protein [Celeribacter sp.]|uniref:PAS-domain containing protein n=1 Tax=Celeribacter sp. TaxID=1890673 RepID=UPI003A94DF8D
MLTQLAILTTASLCVAFVVIYATASLSARREQNDRLALEWEDGETAFLFDDEHLVDATPEARAILEGTPRGSSDWSRLISAFLTQFPDLPTRIAHLADEQKMIIESKNGQASLICEWRRGLARISLKSVDAEDSMSEFDRHFVQAMEQELETLRATAENGPILIWHEAPDGTITWANSAYLGIADSFDEGDGVPRWPPRRLFGDLSKPPVGACLHDRLRIESAEGEILWFDVYRSNNDGEMLFSAIPADDAVQTETALRAFTETLTKSFSHLAIGMAVFDHDRKLAFFNPALIALTTLEEEFLEKRPTLTLFLDTLRDRRMMPEPKDYKSWRQKMSALESAAEHGTFEEQWALPSDTTYRVTGHPHPDGAIAFLFEDITSEMTLTRRFRTEIETGQAVIDSLEEAIAVFGPDGCLVMSNTAYDALWNTNEDGEALDMGIVEATRIWRSKCAPTSIWSDIKAIVGGEVTRENWSGSTRLWDGRRLSCRITPLSGGQTVAGFIPETRTPSNYVPRATTDPEFVEM